MKVEELSRKLLKDFKPDMYSRSHPSIEYQFNSHMLKGLESELFKRRLRERNDQDTDDFLDGLYLVEEIKYYKNRVERIEELRNVI
jgi:hypothetical protein